MHSLNLLPTFIVIVLGYFVSSCCNEKINNESKEEEILIAPQDSINDMIQGLGNGFFLNDSAMIADCWNRLKQLDTVAIDYLIEEHVNNNDPITIIPNQGKVMTKELGCDFYKEYGEPKLNSLYLISAIYYDDLDFALLTRVWYQPEAADSALKNDSPEFERCICSGWCPNVDFREVWDHVVQWRNSGYSLAELREKKMRPLPDDHYWVGEEGSVFRKEDYLRSGE